MLGEPIAALEPAARARRARLRRPRLGQGGRAAVRPLRGRRRGARPRDALDRRGHGHRARLPDRLRQGAGRRRRAAAAAAAPCSSRSPTPTRRAPSPSPSACTTTAFASSRRAAPPRRSRAWAIPAQALNKVGEGSPHVVDWIERGDVDLVVNTPTGSGARTDGWQIRRAAVTRGIPCLTTLAAGVSAARAISSARAAGQPPVLCLQELHRGRDAVEVELMALAPFARRLLQRRRRRATSVPIACCTPTTPAPAPDPGQFAMLAAAERWGGGEDERPLPATRLLVRPRRRARPGQFLLEDVGPGTHRLCELARRRGALAARAARPRLHAARPRPTGAARRRRHRHRAAGDLAGRAVGRRRGAGGHRLLGFRDRAHAARRRALRDARVATDDGSAGHHGCVTELLAAELDARPARDRLRLRPRRRCSRPSRALCAERDVPAQLALEAGMACGFGACYGCVVPRRGGGYLRVCVDGPVIDAAELERFERSAIASTPGLRR